LAPAGHWQTPAFLAGLTADGLSAPLMRDGPIHGGIFTAYTEQILAPELREGDFVILDNLSSHKGKAAAAASANPRFCLHGMVG
jgi:hypothetical protein